MKLFRIINNTSNDYTQEIKFSPDNHYIIFGGTHREYHNNELKCPIYFYNIKTKKIDKTFWKHNATVQYIAFSKSGRLIASTGGYDNETYIYNSKTLKVVQKIISKGKCVYSIGFGNDGKTIYFGNNNGDPSGGTPQNGTINKSFSLLDLVIDNSPDNNYTRIYDEINGQTIDFTGELFNKTITIAGNTITPPNQNDTIFSYTITPDGKCAIIGSNFALTKVRVDTGDIVGNFIGHEGIITTVSVSANSKYLISGSTDQIIKIWNINNLEDERKLVDYDWFDDNWKNFVKTNYPDLNLTKQEDIKKLYGYLLRDYGANEAKKLINKYPTSEPIATIFIPNDNKYLIWTPDNYYTGDKKLFKYVGWHINQGEDREAKFDLKYNRPDIILQRLGFVNKMVINAYYSMYQKRLKKMGFKQADLTGEIHIPTVSFKTDVQGGVTDRQKICLSIKANDTQFELDRLSVFINGVPLKNQHIKEYSTMLPINLIYGRNKVQASILNSVGTESFKETVNIQCKKPHAKPDLYIATIGVSNYRNNKWDLEYTDKDAEDIVNTYKKEKGLLFSDIHILALNNKKAVKMNIDRINAFFWRE